MGLEAVIKAGGQDLSATDAAELIVAVRPRIPESPLVAIADGTSGVVTLIPAPGVGKRLVVHYLYFTPSGDPPLVTVRFAGSGDSLFHGYAAGKTWRWEAAENEAVEAELGAAGNVAFTLLYEEVTV